MRRSVGSSTRAGRGAQCSQGRVGGQLLFRDLQGSILHAVVQDSSSVVEAAGCFLLMRLEAGVVVLARCLIDDSQCAAHSCDSRCVYSMRQRSSFRLRWANLLHVKSWFVLFVPIFHRQAGATSSPLSSLLYQESRSVHLFPSPTLFSCRHICPCNLNYHML
jgi:hypothetical protein